MHALPMNYSLAQSETTLDLIKVHHPKRFFFTCCGNTFYIIIYALMLFFSLITSHQTWLSDLCTTVTELDNSQLPAVLPPACCMLTDVLSNAHSS